LGWGFFFWVKGEIFFRVRGKLVLGENENWLEENIFSYRKIFFPKKIKRKRD